MYVVAPCWSMRDNLKNGNKSVRHAFALVLEVHISLIQFRCSFLWLIQVTSFLTGPIVVDEVIYENLDDYDDDLNCKSESQDLVFRRLTFQRSHSLVQSEALLSTEGSDGMSSEVEENKVQATSRTRKKGKQGQFDSHSSGSYGEDLLCALSWLAFEKCASQTRIVGCILMILISD